MSSSEKRSGSTATNSPVFPDDVLIIHYADLSLDPLIRLEVIAAIGRLLDTSSQSQLVTSLVSLPASAQALRSWLSDDQPGRFWRVEGDVIVPHHPCEKHVLVGTLQLLRDLNIFANMLHVPRLSDLDLVWQAAAHSIERLMAGKIDF